MSDGEQVSKPDLGADSVPDNAADLTLFVQNLLEQMVLSISILLLAFIYC